MPPTGRGRRPACPRVSGRDRGYLQIALVRAARQVAARRFRGGSPPCRTQEQIAHLGALPFAIALALASTAFPGSAAAFDVHARHRQAFLGFWEGVDPLDGSTVQASISGIEGDGVLELSQREGFFTVCFQLGSDHSLGRGLVRGTGTIVAGGLFEVELSLTCIDDDNNLGTPLPETLQYRLESRGRIFVVPGLDGAPDILLHRTSR